MKDHARGCEGRNYTCTCGHDDASTALVEKLTKALEPFAKAADVKLCGEWKDDERFGQTDVSFYLTFGDLRRARSALSSSQSTSREESR